MESRSPRLRMIANSKIFSALLVGALILPAALLGQEPAFIEVTGSAIVSVEADRVTVSLAVETIEETAADASGSNADIMDAVFRRVRSSGLADLDIETFGYSLSPQYRNAGNRGPPEIVAYQSTNNVRVTTSAVGEAGTLIDLAMAAGANRILGLDFFASETDGAEREALAAATRDAREQAEVIAESLARLLGAPVEVRGGAQSRTPQRAFAMEMARAAPTPIEGGAQTVSASVTVRFLIGPPR